MNVEGVEGGNEYGGAGRGEMSTWTSEDEEEDKASCRDLGRAMALISGEDMERDALERLRDNPPTLGESTSFCESRSGTNTGNTSSGGTFSPKL